MALITVRENNVNWPWTSTSYRENLLNKITTSYRSQNRLWCSAKNNIRSKMSMV